MVFELLLAQYANPPLSPFLPHAAGTKPIKTHKIVFILTSGGQLPGSLGAWLFEAAAVWEKC